MSDQIYVYDCTAREAEQNKEISHTVEAKLELCRTLHRFGLTMLEGPWQVPMGEAQDSEDLHKVQEFWQRIFQVVPKEAMYAFGSTREKGVETWNSPRLLELLKTGAVNFTIFGKTWDRHVTEVVKTTFEENLAMICDSVFFLKRHGQKVIFDAEHFFDGFLSNPDYALSCLKAAYQGGANWVVLCDTNGGMLPNQIMTILSDRRFVQLVNGRPFGVHLHNDTQCAMANALLSIDHGARMIQGTFNGEAERCAMVPTSQLLANLILKLGRPVAGFSGERSLVDLRRVSEEVALRQNVRLDPASPYVGSNAFTHKAGQHQYGVFKNPELQEHVDPSLVGNERSLPMSGIVGLNSIRDKLKNHGLELDNQQLLSFQKAVLRLDGMGYMFEDAEESFLVLAMKFAGNNLPNLMPQEFEASFKCVMGSDDVYLDESRASVRLPDQSEEVVHSKSTNGLFDTIAVSLRNSLSARFPEINNVNLVDYRVWRVSKNGEGTASLVRVGMVHEYHGKMVHTAGVHHNIILASLMALGDAYTYAISKQ